MEEQSLEEQFSHPWCIEVKHGCVIVEWQAKIKTVEMRFLRFRCGEKKPGLNLKWVCEMMVWNYGIKKGSVKKMKGMWKWWPRCIRVRWLEGREDEVNVQVMENVDERDIRRQKGPGLCKDIYVWRRFWMSYLFG